jgi:hypothetical protein
MATSTKTKKPVFTAEDRDKFNQTLAKVMVGDGSIEALSNSLGASRQGETAALAREELKRILDRREEIDDLLELESGTLWSLDEEKLFEYGLYLHDGSTPDRFGQIASLMCNTRSREECKKRYQKLILDVCQIELGMKSLSVVYFAPYQAGMPTVASTGSWMS